jgi:hypothetical protein
MLLSARPLKDVQNVNSFEPDSQLSWTEGDVIDIYFSLVDLSLDHPEQGFNPSGRRYIPSAGATLSVVIENIDDSKKLTRLASQPFAGDGSIWKLALTASDKCRGTPQMRLTLTEGTKVTRGLLKNSLKIHPATNL